MFGFLPEGTEVIWSIYNVSIGADMKASLPIYVTLGKCTIERLRQYPNASLPTDEHNGKSMDVNAEQTLNASLPTYVHFGKLIDDNERQFTNTL